MSVPSLYKYPLSVVPFAAKNFSIYPAELIVPKVKTPVLGVAEPIAPGAAKVAPFKLLAFKLATLVVEATVSGAVPVVTVDAKDNPLTALPEVKSATDTFLVVLLWTIGKTSVPARGTAPEVKAEIFESAII
jgi:hypothetical protein